MEGLPIEGTHPFSVFWKLITPVSRRWAPRSEAGMSVPICTKPQLNPVNSPWWLMHSGRLPSGKVTVAV